MFNIFIRCLLKEKDSRVLQEWELVLKRLFKVLNLINSKLYAFCAQSRQI